MPADREMQMGSSNAAGIPAGPQDRVDLNLFACLDFDFREMQVEREQALSVVKPHAVALKVEIPRQDDRAVVRRAHYGADRGMVVESLMLALLDSVKHARRSELAGNSGLDRRTEPARPVSFLRYLRKQALLQRVLFRNARQHVLRRLNLLWSNADRSCRVGLLADRDFVSE